MIQFPARGASVEFVRDIQPIFQARCVACHGAQSQFGGLRLDRPGVPAAVIKPGDSSHSLLVRKVSGLGKTVMPPSGAKLTAQQISLLKTWIDAGAIWPSNSVISAASHWSYQPIAKPALPPGDSTNPIDRFILARLKKESARPSPPAAKAIQLRRLSLDLTGLPPTPEESADFLADPRPDAYEREADRLLASPHFGEKWARAWLDLAHYADSDGYEKDLVRPYAWRYRDWLINALNRDMPYDEFTIDQIAGDELPGATIEDKVATGFFRQTLTNREGGIDRMEDRFEQRIDRTGTLGTTWLGLTVRCAQCHDHKYDPISHQDYYQLYAFFNNAEETEIDAPRPGELGPFLHKAPEFNKRLNEILTTYNIAALQARWEDKIRESMATPGKNLDWDFLVTDYRSALERSDEWIALTPDKRRPRDNAVMTRFFITHLGPDIPKDKELAAKMKEARAKVEALDAEFPKLTEAAILRDFPEATPAHIQIRGDYKQPGAVVQPNSPHFLPPMKPELKKEDSKKPAANRLALARWIMAPENPLTARVQVNRIWQELFGAGIVATSEDFGSQGDRPTHPELLDWLASEFRDGGWSQKRLIKQIVMSDTYRQSSVERPDLETKDPGNTLLARQSRLRLSAEAIRDEALSVSGLLNPAVGGPSIRPYQPAGVAELAYNNSVKWKESAGGEAYRRGLYIHYQRTTPYPFLANFDEPDSTLACTRRRTSNTPLQALNLLNDPVFFEAAKALSYRVDHERKGDFDEKLNFAFSLCLNREPSAKERERLQAYFSQTGSWEGVSRILLNLDEFITRE